MVSFVASNVKRIVVYVSSRPRRSLGWRPAADCAGGPTTACEREAGGGGGGGPCAAHAPCGDRYTPPQPRDHPQPPPACRHPPPRNLHHRRRCCSLARATTAATATGRATTATTSNYGLGSQISHRYFDVLAF